MIYNLYRIVSIKFFFSSVVFVCDTNFQFIRFEFHCFNYFRIQSSLFCEWIIHMILGWLTAFKKNDRTNITLLIYYYNIPL